MGLKLFLLGIALIIVNMTLFAIPSAMPVGGLLVLIGIIWHLFKD